MREADADDPDSTVTEKSLLLGTFSPTNIDPDTTSCQSPEQDKWSAVTMAPRTPTPVNLEPDAKQEEETTTEDDVKEETDAKVENGPSNEDGDTKEANPANGDTLSTCSDTGETRVSIEPSVAIEEDAVSRISSIQGDMCRICHCVAEEAETLISPCDCRGSMKWVHQRCLQRWVKSRDAKKCELCGFVFNMTSSVKPFRKWKKLDMSSVERRRVLCSVTFHVVAITCVIWSLYVLIDRTTQEIQQGKLNWPFWTKLVVVAIGFTGGLVFMYVQCKTYVKLFKRWKQFNRVIYINDIELVEEPSPKDENATDLSQEDNGTAVVVVVNMPNDGTEQPK